MNNATSMPEASGDLFGKMPSVPSSSAVRRRAPPELALAQALCRQIRRQRAPREKRRIAHLICLNLLAILRHKS